MHCQCHGHKGYECGNKNPPGTKTTVAIEDRSTTLKTLTKTHVEWPKDGTPTTTKGAGEANVNVLSPRKKKQKNKDKGEAKTVAALEAKLVAQIT